MESNSSFLTESLVRPLVATNVVADYLISVSGPRFDHDVSVLEAFHNQVSERCFIAANTVLGVINQMRDRADRIVRSRSDAIAFIFLGETKYGMLESDEEGVVVAMLSDRSRSAEAETWVVEPGGLAHAVQRIRAFLGTQHGTKP